MFFKNNEVIQPRVNIALVGAGQGGTALLKMLRYIKEIKIAAICDINIDAPGIELAKQESIPVYKDINELMQAQAIDWIINVADKSITQRFILTREYSDIKVIDGQIAELGLRILMDFAEQTNKHRLLYLLFRKTIRKNLYQLAWSVLKEVAKATQPLQSEVINIAFFDSLTGLYSRRIVMEFLEREIKHSHRLNYFLSVIMIDIDNFKLINDTFGHPEGDRVLKDLAVLLNKSHRMNDLIARYGGEEFIIVLHNTNVDTATKRAEGLRERIEKNLKSPDGKAITISLGIAELNAHKSLMNLNIDNDMLKKQCAELIKNADQALYAAKNSGKNRVCAYNSDVN